MCRVRVCVCARMAALLISVGWFAMVCILLLFHFCLFHISLVRMILCQRYLRAKVLKTTLAPLMVASTLITCAAFAACVKKKEIKSWMKSSIFPIQISWFVWVYIKYTWSVLVEIKQNKHSMHFWVSERLQSGSTLKGVFYFYFFKPLHFIVFTLLGGYSHMAVSSISLCTSVGSLQVQGGDKGEVETLKWPFCSLLPLLP